MLRCRHRYLHRRYAPLIAPSSRFAPNPPSRRRGLRWVFVVGICCSGRHGGLPLRAGCMFLTPQEQCFGALRALSLGCRSIAFGLLEHCFWVLRALFLDANSIAFGLSKHWFYMLGALLSDANSTVFTRWEYCFRPRASARCMFGQTQGDAKWLDVRCLLFGQTQESAPTAGCRLR